MTELTDEEFKKLKEEDIETDVMEDIQNEEEQKEIEQAICEHEYQLGDLEVTSDSYIWCEIKCDKCGSRWKGAVFKKD